METKLLSVSQISKNFGLTQALNNVSFSLNAGDSLGLLGRNGSGKTTLLSIISGIQDASGGTFEWENSENKLLNNKEVGMLLEAPAFYPYLNAVDNLKIVCKIKDIPYSEIEPVLHEVEMYERRTVKFRNYSLGMKQRLGLASAIIGQPKMLILDEPTNGLDPEGISFVRNIIMKKRDAGISVILASHILDEVEKVCNKLVVLDKGALKYSGDTRDLISPKNELKLEYEDINKLENALNSISFISEKKVMHDHILITIPETFKSADVSKLLFEQDIILSGISANRNSLEQEFLNLLKE